MNKALSLWLIFIFWTTYLTGQDDSISGLINRYTVVNEIEYCSATLKVESTQGFLPDSKVILIQMQGGLINNSNSSAYGTITDIGSAGLFEQAEISSVDGAFITLHHQLINEYDPTRGLQLVSLPSFQNATITDTLFSSPWNGKTGGVLALEVQDLLVMEAAISVSGQGFSGGNKEILASACNWAVPQNDFYYAQDNWRGAAKGHGIVPIFEGQESGRGPLANAGGGGNDHNCGGGGGSNVASGGQGGIYSAAGLFSCKGEHPGMGGNSLPNEKKRLYMGGGGGAGHVDDTGGGSSGAAGGGIIFLMAKRIQTNGHQILANGLQAETASGDGAGGGGAGGSILLLAEEIMGNLVLQASGGKGGETRGSEQRCFGPGGGGGGGKIISNLISFVNDWKVDGGSSGIVSGNLARCEGENNGATNGMDGSIQIESDVLPIGDQSIAASNITNQPSNQIVCESQVAKFELELDGHFNQIQWQINTGDGFEPIMDNNIYDGAQEKSLIIRAVSEEMFSHRFRAVISSDCFGELTSVDVGLSIKPKPIALFEYVQQGRNFVFTNKSENASQVSWDFGDGAQSSINNPIHQFQAGQTFVVVLTVSNDCGEDQYTVEISTVAPPVAIISSENPRSCVPYTIKFSSSETENASSVAWEFPGATPSSSSATDPEVSYTEPGEYTVILYASNSAGTDTVILENYVQLLAPPISAFGFEVEENTVRFSNQSENASEFQWDFGDQSPVSTEFSPVHTYDKADFYTVTLEARNDYCSSALARSFEIVLPTARSNVKLIPTLKVYPNPGKERFWLDWKDIQIDELHLMSGDGKVLQSFDAKNKSSLQLDLSQYPNGIYLLQLVSPIGNFYKKLVKMK